MHAFAIVALAAETGRTLGDASYGWRQCVIEYTRGEHDIGVGAVVSWALHAAAAAFGLLSQQVCAAQHSAELYARWGTSMQGAVCACSPADRTLIWLGTSSR